MVLEEIRRQAGDEFIVGIRYVIDEGDEAGLTLEEGVEMARLFERTGMLDFFNAIYGRMDTERALATDNMPGMASLSRPGSSPSANSDVPCGCRYSTRPAFQTSPPLATPYARDCSTWWR